MVLYTYPVHSCKEKWMVEAYSAIESAIINSIKRSTGVGCWNKVGSIRCSSNKIDAYPSRTRKEHKIQSPQCVFSINQYSFSPHFFVSPECDDQHEILYIRLIFPLQHIYNENGFKFLYSKLRDDSWSELDKFKYWNKWELLARFIWNERKTT